MENIHAQLAERIRAAAEKQTPLRIVGGNSKAFYGPPVKGDELDVKPYRGIIEYEPSELVISVRAGTPLREVESALAERGQMLPFEPPYFGEHATIGGCVATGLSGPPRASRGSVRDFVLGVRIIDGLGIDQRFGGKVIKNVAGYDVSRLMTGALGTLGVITEASFKILPLPVTQETISFEITAEKAIDQINRWAAQPLPLSATCHAGDRLWVRLSGTSSAVATAKTKLGGEIVSSANEFWNSIREQTNDFFQSSLPLWRLSVPSVATPISLAGKQLIEWGGAQRWLLSDVSHEIIRDAVEEIGGHATRFNNQRGTGAIFHPLAPAIATLHRRLKSTFDPRGILNPGRMDNF
jgi:glycolate oxidase FAD binding subunit